MASITGMGASVERPAEWVGARTPEELETLFEDALVMRDGAALAGIFGAGAVLEIHRIGAARGVSDLVPLALARWQDDRAYVADPRTICQAVDIALIVSATGINVARRGRHGIWRYVIVLQDICAANEWRRS